MTHGRSRLALGPRRVTASVAAGALLLVAVALSGRPAAPAASPAETRAGLVVVAVLFGAAAGFAGWILRALPFRRRPPDQRWVPPVRRGGWPLIVGFLTCVALVLATLIVVSAHRGPRPESRPEVPPTLPAPNGHSTRSGTPEVPWRLILIVGTGAAVATGVLLAWGGGRSPRQPQPTGPAPKPPAPRMHALSDAILSDPDPRRAVVGAYALMEAALAARERPRDPAEGPREYLARLGASPPEPTRLTGLFERAAFSASPVDESMRQAARDALAALRAR